MKTITEKIRSSGKRIFSAIWQASQSSIRQLAAKAGTSKSSAHRLLQGIKRRNKHPESYFWETEEGQAWLRRQFFATLLIFGVQQGCGADIIFRYFDHLRLGEHIGISPSALRSKLTELQNLIITFQQEFEKKQGNTKKEVIAAADETFFFNLLILVFMDLSSGYILLENIAADRSFDTWLETVEPRLKELDIEVRIMISDRANALLKLAFDGLGCEHGCDIFHAQRDISAWLGLTFGRVVDKAQKHLNQCQADLGKAQAKGVEKTVEEVLQKEVAQATSQHQVATQDLEEYRGALRSVSEIIHPFKMTDNGVQDSAEAQRRLAEQVDNLEALARNSGIADKKGVVTKIRKQLKGLTTSIDSWWLAVLVNLPSRGVTSKDVTDWLMYFLLPTVYWWAQVEKTKNTALRKEYRKAYKNALSRLQAHALTRTFTEDEIFSWQSWAEEMVRKFHRASSAVEGRNGFISQIFHNRRGLSLERLKALTVLHNYFIERADGTTAAERLFGEKPPDLFEWLLERMGELPLPRRSRTRVESKPLDLLFVPA